MRLAAAGLEVQPFQTHGKPLIFVPYASQKAAFEFLDNVRRHNHGLGLIQGPPLSGKTTILRHFAHLLSKDCAAAVVDGAGKDITTLMRAVLSQFGYDVGLKKANEQIGMIRVFAMQQAATGHAPQLIIENTHALKPDVLHALCELAELKVNAKSALRLVLSSDQSILPIVRAPAMMPMFERLTGELQLGHLTEEETTRYLYSKLRGGGCNDPEAVLPRDVCEALHSASGGWPGKVDRLAVLALAKAKACPVRVGHVEGARVPHQKPVPQRKLKPVRSTAPTGVKRNRPPKIILSYRGKTLRRVSLSQPRLLIGRSKHNDLRIDNHLISRHHALLIRDGNTTFLMDLNSANGTYVNSRRVSNQVLIDDDIISLGDYRIKFIDPSAKVRTAVVGTGFNETMIARTLTDVRNVLAKGTLRALPVFRSLKKPAGKSA